MYIRVDYPVGTISSHARINMGSGLSPYSRERDNRLPDQVEFQIARSVSYKTAASLAPIPSTLTLFTPPGVERRGATHRAQARALCFRRLKNTNKPPPHRVATEERDLPVLGS